MMIRDPSFRKNCLCCLSPYKGKIQDWENQANVVPVGTALCYFLFDVHYYLSGWQPKYPGRVLLVGGSFSSLPGQYLLPMQEGSYRVFRD